MDQRTTDEIVASLAVGPLSTKPVPQVAKHNWGPSKLWREHSAADSGWRLNYRPQKETWTEWFAEEEDAFIDEFKKGEEWVASAAKSAVEVAKDAGAALLEEDKVIYKKVVGGAWTGVKEGLHSTVELATAGMETVVGELGMPVLVVAAALFVLWNRN